MKESMQMGINEAKYMNGGRLIVHPVAEKSNTVPGQTAHHEAEHAVVAEKTGTDVIDATIIPGPGYSGLTRLSRYNALAAGAPHGRGRSGTSWDMFVISRVSGNAESHARRGAQIAAQNQDAVHAVASGLEEKGTLSGGEIKEIISRVDRKEKNVEIIFELPDGTKQKIERQKSVGGVVFVNNSSIMHGESEQKQ